MKKKAIKVATASAIAASAFVAAAPAQTDAASNVAVEVSKAVTQMKKAYHTYSDVTANGEFQDIKVVYKEYNAAKAAYNNAKAVVKTAGGSAEAAYNAQLDVTYNDYIAKRVVTYIDAYNYATTLDGMRAELVDALEAKEWDQAEELYHAISYELKTRTVILHRVYGVTARELLVEEFKLEAQEQRDSIVNEVSVKMYYDKAEGLVADGKLEEAKAAMDKVAEFVAKLDKDTDFGAALLTKVAEVEAAYEAELTPSVESVSAINSTQVKVVFNQDVTSATPANFTVTRKDDTNVRQFVSKVEVSSTNKKEVTVTFADKLTADKSYELVANGVVSGTKKVEDSKMDFYYAKSVPTTISFDSTTIAPTKNIKDILTVTDQLGRDITDEVELVVESSDLATVALTGATADKGGDNVADKAIVKVSVKGTSVSTASTIVTVSDATPATFVGFHIGADETAKDTSFFNDKKAEDVVTSVSMGNATNYLNMYFVDQYGKDTDAKVGAEVTYTNLNPSVLVVGANGQITPISTGTGLVKVKVGDLETTVAITVKAASAATTMNVDKTTVNAAVGAIAETFAISFKDQYGEDINFDSTKLSIKSADETVAKATTAATGSVAKVTYSVNAIKEGTTTFTVTYTDGTTKYEKVIPVVISKAGSLNSYKVEVDYSVLDLNAAATETKADSTVAGISVYSLDSNGNKLAKLSASSDVTVAFVDETATNAVKSKLTLSDAADTLTINSSVASSTSAQVAVKVGSYVVDTLTFEVKDTSAKASKVEFNNNALPTLASGDVLDAKVLGLVKLYDQYGKEITNTTGLKIAAADLIVTNSVNKFAVDGLGQVTVTGADLKKDSTADIVVTKITNGADTTNLLSAPVVIKAVVKGDAVAPSAPVLAKLSVTDNTSTAVDTLSGTAGAVEAGSTVKVYSDAALTTLVGSKSAIADGSFPAIDLTDAKTGDITYYVVSVDTAGNVSSSTAITYTASN